jgi:hypothetical protein
MQITPGLVILASLATLKSVAALPVDDATFDKRVTNGEPDAPELNERQANINLAVDAGSLLGSKLGAALAGSVAGFGLGKLIMQAIHSNNQQQPQARELEEFEERAVTPAVTTGLTTGLTTSLTTSLSTILKNFFSSKAAAALGGALAGAGAGALTAQVQSNQPAQQPDQKPASRGLHELDARELDELVERALDWAQRRKVAGGEPASTLSRTGVLMAADKFMNGGRPMRLKSTLRGGNQHQTHKFANLGDLD